MTQNGKKTVIIIPARYGSTRFSGKPLAMIKGVSMIKRVYDRCLSSHADAVYVATDDVRIMRHIQEFKGNVIMTEATHLSGTDRCAEAIQKCPEPFDFVVNVQGDEPYIDPEQINQVIGILDSKSAPIATLVVAITSDEELRDPNRVKVVMAGDSRCLYFSRSAIPYDREGTGVMAFRHLGIYGFQTEVLRGITQLSQGKLEKAESLEQLRWLEHGIEIYAEITKHAAISVDTPDDINRLL
jgi:3-deoxy-manno-octulosonate cytidylyltransferase (CMP-KDO synthetase)